MLDNSCVSCGQSFPNLQAVTDHMFQTQHIEIIRSSSHSGHGEDAAPWRDDRFLIPVWPDDALLFSLEDGCENQPETTKVEDIVVHPQESASISDQELLALTSLAQPKSRSAQVLPASTSGQSSSTEGSFGGEASDSAFHRQPPHGEAHNQMIAQELIDTKLQAELGPSGLRTHWKNEETPL